MVDSRTDSTDRRNQLLDRLADAIAEGGIEGVSIRDLAQRAGVSIGTVQYYFSTKTDLLTAAWYHVRDQAVERFRQSGIGELEPGEQLLGVTELLLTPTPEHRLSRMWLALVARAAHDPGIAALHREQWADTAELLARLLAAANPVRAAESADAATELLGLLDGLSIAVLTEPDRVSPERGRRIARGWVRRWLD
ncbi:TetR/AcrR family transcriptional regulator [Nocardia inohanensis]|uniref:TetR/AcrR family transcriptional regulator n=1 Tax=Nocardia inohanensis TaxID=209246 RepID=UPI000A753FF5|nr:TetR/AcrR family transcriptional regulator [Nocardia inohanensis]